MSRFLPRFDLVCADRQDRSCHVDLECTLRNIEALALVNAIKLIDKIPSTLSAIAR